MSQISPSSPCSFDLSTIADLPSGFSLAGSTPETIGIAIIAIVVLAITIAVVYFGVRRSKRSASPPGSSEPSSIALSGYNTARGGENGYGPGHGEDSLSVGTAPFSHV